MSARLVSLCTALGDVKSALKARWSVCLPAAPRGLPRPGDLESQRLERWLAALFYSAFGALMTLKSNLINLERRFANDGARRRDHIVLCAAELFTGYGYDATSTDALAKR